MPIRNTLTSGIGIGGASGALPRLDSFTGTINQNISTTVQVDGGNFTPGSIIYVQGPAVSGVDRALSTVFVSSTTLTANTNSTSVNYVGGATFNIYVVSGAGGVSNTILNAGTVDQTPVWNTASGSLGFIIEGQAVNTSVSATDPDGTAITYSIVSGALPSGVSLNSSTGAITGTAPTVSGDQVFNFTIRAAGGGGSTFAQDRAFSLTVGDSMTISSSSTSGANNPYTSTATNNQIQRQSGNTKPLSISGAGFRSGATVTLGGQACTSVNVVSATSITCTTPSFTYSAGQTLTVTVTNGVTGQAVNSPNTISTQRFGATNFPAQTGQQLYNAGDTTTNACTTYRFRTTNLGYSGGEFTMYGCGSSYDGGGYDMQLCQGCTSFNYFNQGNSCNGRGLRMWSPRSQPNWQASQSIWGWTGGTGNGNLTYVYKPNSGGNYTGGPFRQGSFYGSGYNDWRVIDGGRWWVRNDGFGEPNGDYDGFGSLQMYSNNGYQMGFNDGGAYNSGSQYVCSSNAKG